MYPVLNRDERQQLTKTTKLFFT